MYLTITWHPKEGLKLYRDSVLRIADDSGRPVQNATMYELDENLTIGRNLGSTGAWRYASYDISSLTTFGQALNQTDIDRAFIFFSSGGKLRCLKYVKTRLNASTLSKLIVETI